jgi:hypothetical protein
MTTPTEFIKTITDMAYNFIWNNKPDKIKRQTLIAEYEKGGLKMLDICSFLKAQKAMWVKRLMSNEKASWKAAPDWYLREFLGIDTFRCNIKCVDKPKDFPHFYWQVMVSWFETKQILDSKEKLPIDVRRECLWLNQYIKVNKQSVKWNDWLKNGIKLINDITNEDGSFLTKANIEQKYGITCDALKYSALKDAIPMGWRRLLKNKKINPTTISFDEDLRIKLGKQGKKLKDITNKELYWTLISRKRKKTIFMAKMQHEFGIIEDEWEDILIIPACVRNTKIRAFQYKLLFGLTPCKLYLNRINKCDTDKCESCNELDDTAHYLFECPQVVPFWNSFMDWWNAMTNSIIFLDKRSAMTGFIGPHEIFNTLNACLLFAKWHVYKRKLDESEVFFHNYLCELKYNIDIEKTIAFKNDKMVGYMQRWQMVEEYIT